METAVPAVREMPRKVGLGPPLRQRPMPIESERPPAPPVSATPTLQRIAQARPAEPPEPRPQPAPKPGPTQLVRLIAPDPPTPEQRNAHTAPLLLANPMRLSAAEQPVQRTSVPRAEPRDRAQPDPVAAALSTGLARLDADGAVVFPGLATTLATPAPQPAAQPTPAPTIQRETVAPAPAPQPQSTTGTEATPKPSIPTSAELDELAARLYDRIRTRMKAELRVDRERAGLVASPYR